MRWAVRDNPEMSVKGRLAAAFRPLKTVLESTKSGNELAAGAAAAMLDDPDSPVLVSDPAKRPAVHTRGLCPLRAFMPVVRQKI